MQFHIQVDCRARSEHKRGQLLCVKKIEAPIKGAAALPAALSLNKPDAFRLQSTAFFRDHNEVLGR